MTLQSRTARFRAAHDTGTPFILPNPWDIGSARMLEGMGFTALATTSSGFAMTLDRQDYGITRDEAISHAGIIAENVSVPVTADLENGFGLRPEDTHQTIADALTTELCGGSIEDSTGGKSAPVITDNALATARIEACRDAIKESGRDFVLTARAEAFLYGDAILDDVITRLNAFADAGADVLYAPGLPTMDAVRAVCANVSKPVNVLILRALAKENARSFAEAGVARLSIGGGLAWSAYGVLGETTAMLRDGDFSILRAHRDGAKKVAPFLKMPDDQ